MLKFLPHLFVFCDNQSAMNLAHNLVQHGRSKHMKIDLFLVREKVVSGEIRVAHIASKNQLDDALTKPLRCTRFLWFKDKLTVLVC